jgi:hypothetical protein
MNKKNRRRGVQLANHLILQQKAEIARLKNRVQKLIRYGAALQQVRQAMFIEIQMAQSDPKFKRTTAREWQKIIKNFSCRNLDSGTSGCSRPTRLSKKARHPDRMPQISCRSIHGMRDWPA